MAKPAFQSNTFYRFIAQGNVQSHHCNKSERLYQLVLHAKLAAKRIQLPVHQPGNTLYDRHFNTHFLQ